MDIKTKDDELFYLSCMIFSEFDKIHSQLLEVNRNKRYYPSLQHILSLKDKWLEMVIK